MWKSDISNSFWWILDKQKPVRGLHSLKMNWQFSFDFLKKKKKEDSKGGQMNGEKSGVGPVIPISQVGVLVMNNRANTIL